MKQKVLSGEEPWSTAFTILKKETPLDFVPEPRVHISVGPYGAIVPAGVNLGKKRHHGL